VTQATLGFVQQPVTVAPTVTPVSSQDAIRPFLFLMEMVIINIFAHCVQGGTWVTLHVALGPAELGHRSY
jgi:hypothetical protein